METQRPASSGAEARPVNATESSRESNSWQDAAYNFYKDQFSANDVGLQAIQRKLDDIAQALGGEALPQWIDRAWEHHLSDLQRALTTVLDETRARMVEKQQRRTQVVPPELEAASSPEAQSAVGDWREDLPADQRRRVQGFEERLAGASPADLQADLASIQDAQQQFRRTNRWPADYWVDQQDAAAFRQVIEERIVLLSHRPEIRAEPENPLQYLSPEVRAHLQQLQARLQRERGGEAPSLEEVVGMVGEEFQKATLIGRNLPVWLLPPALKKELQLLFGLPAQIPIRTESIPGDRTGRRVRRNG